MKSLYNLFTTKGQLIALVIGLVVIALSLISIFSGLSSAGYEVGTDLNALLKSDDPPEFGFFNTAISLPVILTVICFALAVLFGIYHLVTNLKGSMKGLIGVLILLVLFFVFYSMSEVETTGKIAALAQKFNVSDGASKLISGGLKTTIFLAVASAVAMVLLEIYNLFK